MQRNRCEWGWKKNTFTLLCPSRKIQTTHNNNTQQHTSNVPPSGATSLVKTAFNASLQLSKVCSFSVSDTHANLRSPRTVHCSICSLVHFSMWDKICTTFFSTVFAASICAMTSNALNALNAFKDGEFDNTSVVASARFFSSSTIRLGLIGSRPEKEKKGDNEFTPSESLSKV